MPDLCVAVPFHSARDGMLEECLKSIRCNNTISIELIGIDDDSSDTASEVAKRYCDDIIKGPGYCNRRPGAIHWPIFNVWLRTKCPYITYMFSDDRSVSPRLATQIACLKSNGALSATYVPTQIIGTKGQLQRVEPARASPVFGGIPAFTEGLVIDRKRFEDVGGLDFPIHVAAMAEAWIWAACGAAGKVQKVDVEGFQFREHPGTITESGRKTYEAHTKITKFYEEDHWRLWKRAEPTFKRLVEQANRINM